MEKWLQEAWEELGYAIEKDSASRGHTRDEPKKWGYDYDDIKKPSQSNYGNVDIDKGGNQGVKCKHEWVTTGRSPITNDVWENCKHCDIAREDIWSEAT
jgi:hypothetical protein